MTLKLNVVLGPCANLLCQNGGTCIEKGNGFLCNCLSNYNGTYCETWIFGKLNFQ